MELNLAKLFETLSIKIYNFDILNNELSRDFLQWTGEGASPARWGKFKGTRRKFREKSSLDGAPEQEKV